MGITTKIQWSHHTFSPWRGCQKVSPGCANCYAERGSKRNPALFGEWGPNGKRVIAVENYWKQPRRWNKDALEAGERRRVFCASIADVFEDRPELGAPRDRLFTLIQETPGLDWLLLTKRPENIAPMIEGLCWPDYGCPMFAPVDPPLPNVWLGTSVEDQKRADERIPILAEIPAAIRFLSMEPLLGPVNLRPWLSLVRGDLVCRDGKHDVAVHQASIESNAFEHPSAWAFHWVIVGGESGPDARPCRLDWIQDIVDQCREYGVACFVKQLGARPVEHHDHPVWWPGHDPFTPKLTGNGFGEYLVSLQDPKGGDPEEWPHSLRVREVPRSPAVKEV